MSPTATSKPAVPPIAEVLQPEDLKVIDLVRASLGDRAAERTKLVILRERAARVIKLDEEAIGRALAYARGEKASSQEHANRGRAAFYTLARKFVLEDRSVLHKFESFGRTLLDTNGVSAAETEDNPLRCPECGRADFKNTLSRGVHRSKAHGVRGENYNKPWVKARRKAERKAKREEKE